LLKLPEIPSNWEPFGNAFTRWLGRTVLKAMGWSVKGEFPNEPKLMFAVAPHTSNWDFIVGLFTMFAIGFKINWLGKHSMFKWPLKRLMESMGGVPVYRHAPQGFVEQVAEQFRKHERLHIAIAPEGTRSKVGKLKSGFLRMATAAEIPVFRVSLDYANKQVVLGDLFYPTGDIEKDERACYEWYGQFGAKFPEKY
jgi:1-acyl-sn-glycerol-3-phosphate acyltransferase